MKIIILKVNEMMMITTISFFTSNPILIKV
jgi:hypothetical protein